MNTVSGLQAKFFTDEAFGYNEWGGSIVASNKNLKNSTGTVRLIRLADLILKKVAKRRLPKQKSLKERLMRLPKVLMKVDIEGTQVQQGGQMMFLLFGPTGAELEVISDLIMSGAIKHVDQTMVEWHYATTTNKGKRLEQIRDLAKGTEVLADVTKTFREIHRHLVGEGG